MFDPLKVLADQAKKKSDDEYAFAVNMGTSALARKPPALAAYQKAIDAANANWQAMSQQKQQAFGAALLAGEQSLYTAYAHMDAGDARMIHGANKSALGGAAYAATDYLTAREHYDCPCQTEGSFQHYSHAYYDRSAAGTCFEQATYHFGLAYQHTQ